MTESSSSAARYGERPDHLPYIGAALLSGLSSGIVAPFTPVVLLLGGMSGREIGALLGGAVGLLALVGTTGVSHRVFLGRRRWIAPADVGTLAIILTLAVGLVSGPGFGRVPAGAPGPWWFPLGLLAAGFGAFAAAAGSSLLLARGIVLRVIGALVLIALAAAVALGVPTAQAP